MKYSKNDTADTLNDFFITGNKGGKGKWAFGKT